MKRQPDEPDPQSSLRAEVERASKNYYYSELQQGIDNRTKRFVVERCIMFLQGTTVLELGYVDGLWTDALRERGASVDIVEGASRHVEHARSQYSHDGNVRVFHTLFQEFRPDRRYETIVAGDMLRYLADPTAFLRNARDWLTDGGALIATIPNSRSLHRRIGTLLGMEKHPGDANARDREVGNLRSYDRYEFRELLLDAGYQVDVLRGCFLKPLPSAQMADWSDELLRAFAEIGEELQDDCWFLYAVCRP